MDVFSTVRPLWCACTSMFSCSLSQEILESSLLKAKTVETAIKNCYGAYSDRLKRRERPRKILLVGVNIKSGGKPYG